MTVIFTVCWTCSRANSSVFLSAPRGHYFFTCWQSTGPWVSKTWVGAEPSTLTPISGVPLWYNLSQLPFSWEDDSQLFSRADLGHNLDVCFNILLLAFFISPPRFFPLPALASSSLLLVPMTPPPPSALVLRRTLEGLYFLDSARRGSSASRFAFLLINSSRAIKLRKGQQQLSVILLGRCLDFSLGG